MRERERCFDDFLARVRENPELGFLFGFAISMSAMHGTYRYSRLFFTLVCLCYHFVCIPYICINDSMYYVRFFKKTDAIIIYFVVLDGVRFFVGAKLHACGT